MQRNPIAKQTLQLYHAALTQTLNAAIAVQDQSQKTMEILLNQSPVVPQEGKQAMNDWFDACRHQTAAIRDVVEEGFKPFNLYYEQ